jgi:protein-tyrosine sulfotransferase
VRGSRPRVRRLVARVTRSRDPEAPRLSAFVGASVGSAPPIFVVGCHRSGTSLLRRILDSHPNIACPPESKFLLPLTDLLRDDASMRGLSSMGYARDDVVRGMAAFASRFFEGYASASGKRRWADKTPNYVDRLPELWELFGPEARFVIIVRNGLDVVFSLVDAGRHYPAIDAHVERAGGDRRIGAAEFWRDQNQRIDAFRLEHPDASHALRYEELTTDTEGVLRSMFDFLAEPWDPRVLDYQRLPHHVGFEDPDVRARQRIEPNSGRFLAWPPEERRRVSEACEPMLSRLGYTDREPAAIRDP